MGFFSTLGKKIGSGVNSLGQKALGGIKKGVKVVSSEAGKIEKGAKSVGSVAGTISSVAGTIGAGAAIIGLEPVAAAALGVSAAAKGVQKGADFVGGVAGKVDAGVRVAKATSIGIQSAERGIDAMRRGDVKAAVQDARMVADAAMVDVTAANQIRKQIERKK
jgi:hypothetical protein